MSTVVNTFPSVYDPSDVDKIYPPRWADVSKEAELVRPALTPAFKDSPKVLAWLIDMQIDFIYPAPIGNLPVPGAVDDARRTVEWIYRNTDKITAIAASLDQHFTYQIFHSPWWVNAQGQNPGPFTMITLDDVKRGLWSPTIDAPDSIKYLAELEASAKKSLMVWPFHCIKGSVGESLIPALSEAIMFHSIARSSQPTFLEKGDIYNREYYSVLEPEVKEAKHPKGQLNVAFLNFINQYDLVYIAGQARSHCVLETINSVMRYFSNQPNVIRKLRFLDDCTSSIPGFEAATDSALKKHIAAGFKFVKSTDSIA